MSNSGNWLFLSYPLSNSTPVYGNAEKPSLDQISSISSGKTSNKTFLTMDSHMGTHIDFPYHFSEDGKKEANYLPEEFVFRNILVVDLPMIDRSDESLLITPEDFEGLKDDPLMELLLIKTGFGQLRSDDRYWQRNPGFAPEVASLLKKKMPALRAIGFDTISLSSFQHRPTGRIAHRSFLIENDILIVEDMDLKQVAANIDLELVIVSPLRFENSDGAPVTVFAKEAL